MSFSRPTIHDVSRIIAETCDFGQGETALELIFEDDEVTPEGYTPTRITIYGLESVLAHRIAQAINQVGAPTSAIDTRLSRNDYLDEMWDELNRER